MYVDIRSGYLKMNLAISETDKIEKGKDNIVIKGVHEDAAYDKLTVEEIFDCLEKIKAIHKGKCFP